MIAFNKVELKNLLRLEEAETWFKAGVINAEQWTKIQDAYASNLYHPPFWLRLILFIATVVGIYAAVGFFAIIIFNSNDSEVAVRILFSLVGLASLLALELFAIKEKHHFKSGVTEAFLYIGISNLAIGLLGFEQSEYVYAFLVLIGGLIAATRYLNFIGILASLAALGFFIFNGLYHMSKAFSAFIPFAFMLVFGAGFFLSRKIQKQMDTTLFTDNFIVLDSALLILAYLSGNYFVVRELSVDILGIYIVEGQDIPFGWFFHMTTSIIPLIYFYFGAKKKDSLLFRIGLLLVLTSVITFKFYYSSGHPEISLTLAGAAILGIAVWALYYLKTIKHGFTREKLLSNKWDNVNAESVVISSTMGGNASTEYNETEFGGGDFGGGGAGSSF